MKKRKVHIIVSGRVQGVGFRYSTYNKAKELNINGWVKNTFDGKVEAMLEGDENNIREMLSWCGKGPSMAFVSNIEILEQPYIEEYKEFTIKR